MLLVGGQLRRSELALGLWGRTCNSGAQSVEKLDLWKVGKKRTGALQRGLEDT